MREHDEAWVRERPCETCPQIDNPDSFIRHLLGREAEFRHELISNALELHSNQLVDNMPPYAEGGTVSENYIDGGESGPICPIPRTSVIFEGQKLTFDDEDSAKFAELVKGHFRKLAGLGGDAE